MNPRRHFGNPTSGPTLHNEQSARPLGATQYKGAEIIQLPSRRLMANLSTAPTGEPSGSSFLSSLKQWTLDILAIAAWGLLTVVTAAGIVASVFLLMSPL